MKLPYCLPHMVYPNIEKTKNIDGLQDEDKKLSQKNEFGSTSGLKFQQKSNYS